MVKESQMQPRPDALYLPMWGTLLRDGKFMLRDTIVIR